MVTNIVSIAKSAGSEQEVNRALCDILASRLVALIYMKSRQLVTSEALPRGI
jgi:hypothetical protein